MTGHQLKKYRKKSGLTQVAAACALGVSQTYLSLLENGDRPLNPELEKKAVKVFGLDPTNLPSLASEYKVGSVTDDQLTADLSALGYPGFPQFKPSRGKNPVDVLLSALNVDQRDARLVEALPWVVLRFSNNMNWNDLVRTAKVYDLQNRLGYVTNVASQMATRLGNAKRSDELRKLESDLEPSKLERENTLCNSRMTNAERNWLRTNRPEPAVHWHLLTDLSPRYLDHYVD